MSRLENVPRLCSDSRLLRLADLGADGASWYADASQSIRDVCDIRGYSFERACSVIAITSPRVHVVRNIRTSLQYLERGEVFDHTLSRTRQSLERWEATGLIPDTSPKVGAFRDALLGDASAVVLDVWIAAALRVPQNAFKRVSVRKLAAQRIERIGRRLKLAPRDAQACIWVGAIRDVGRNPARFDFRSEFERFRRYDYRFPLSGSIL